MLGSLNPTTAIYTQCALKCTPAIVANLRNYYGLDQPWYIQYAHYLTRLAHFDLGVSWLLRGSTVWSIMHDGVPVSLLLGILAIGGQVVVGVPLGIYSAVRARSHIDTLINTLGLALLAIPVFLLIPFYQLLTVFLVQHHMPHLPLSGWGDPIDLVVPVILLTLTGLGFYLRLMRTSMLEVLERDYVRTARAKGLRERRVIMRHALRNALIPLLTALGPALASIVTGLFFVETAFQIPGIAFAAIGALGTGDVPVMQATTNLAALAVVVMNLVTDIVYGLVDPRIRVT